jgi:hypothetical protein
MSTIEEAREQARTALNSATVARRYSVHPDAGTLERALRALLDATEPPAQADRPAEDEREALVEVIRLFFQNWRAIGKVSAALEVSIDSLEGAVDDLIELTGPRPITDEMVEAAAREYHERGNGEGSFARTSGHVRTSLLFRMKCALRAAEEARR